VKAATTNHHVSQSFFKLNEVFLFSRPYHRRRKGNSIPDKKSRLSTFFEGVGEVSGI